MHLYEEPKAVETADNSYVSIKALVVPVSKTLSDTLRDLKEAGMRGIRGVRWLQAGCKLAAGGQLENWQGIPGETRRIGNVTSR